MRPHWWDINVWVMNIAYFTFFRSCCKWSEQERGGGRFGVWFLDEVFRLKILSRKFIWKDIGHIVQVLIYWLFCLKHVFAAIINSIKEGSHKSNTINCIEVPFDIMDHPQLICQNRPAYLTIGAHTHTHSHTFMFNGASWLFKWGVSRP